MAADNGSDKLRVEVVLAMPDKQESVMLELAGGSTIADAIDQSGIAGLFEGFELDRTKVGIFGQRAAVTQELRDGDRVEIYRPLIADPKESRRQRAQKQEKEKGSG